MASGIILVVTKLEVDNHPDAIVLANRRIRVIARTEQIEIEGDTNFEILWGGDLGINPIISHDVLETSFPPGWHTVTAEGAGGGQSLTIGAWEFEGEITNGSEFVITDEPRMPIITAQASVLGPGAAINEWECSVIFSPRGADDCDGFPTGIGEVSIITVTQLGGNQFTLNFDKIRGRDVVFIVKFTAAGQVHERSFFALIRGTNPQQNDIQAILSHNTLRQIACRESGQRQFDAPADGGVSQCPLFSKDKLGRVGIMQVPDPTPDETWNWRLNVAKGIELFDTKVSAAKNYPNEIRNSPKFNRLVDQFNQKRQQQGLNPIQVVLPNFTTGSFDDNLQQLELDTIRGYNGWFGQDRFGELHEFKVAVDVVNGGEVLRVTNIDEQALVGEAVWERVLTANRPQNLGDPNYVNSVLVLSAACQLQSVPIPVLSGPTSVERGSHANYQVINVPAGATFSNWRFIGGGVTINRPGNNNVPNWQGNMVQSGTIGVDVTIGGVIGPLSLSLNIVVTPRPWTENTPSVPLVRTGNGDLDRVPRHPLGRDLGRTDSLDLNGNVGIGLNFDFFKNNSDRITVGPNEGFHFVVAPPITWNIEVITNDALYDGTHPFFRAHNRNPLPPGRIGIGELQTNVEAHEGVITPPAQAPPNYASHWQLVLNHLAIPANQINIPLEGDIAYIPSNQPDFQVRVEEYRDRIVRSTTNRAIAAWDASAPQPTGHPQNIFIGNTYYHYPYIFQRNLTLQVGSLPVILLLLNPRGGQEIWNSTDPAVATVDASGIVSPVSPGSTTIRVTNADGDIDEVIINVV